MKHAKTTERQKTTSRRQPAGESASPAASLRPPPYGVELAERERLAIGPVRDRSEQEADEVADRVMRMAAPAAAFAPAPAPRLAPDARGHLRRACARCDEEDAALQRKEAGDGAAPAAAPAIVHEVLRSPGQALDLATRAFMEPRFGRDFGGVRIHTDARAAESAAAVGARAYTVGQHLVFAAGEYAPQTDPGRRLLAHELAHAVQQRGTRGALQRQAGPGYDIQLTYPPSHTERHQALPLPEALRVLQRFATRIYIHIEGGYEGHRYLHQIHDDQFIVAGISDLLGGRSIPSLMIWSVPRLRLNTARAAIARGDVAAAARDLQEAAITARAAERQVYEYREGTIAGAERAIFALEVVQVAAAATITVGTGGTAGVLLGAGYAGTQRLAGEISRVAYGLQDEIDWAGVAFDTLFAAIAGRFGGRLGAAILARLGGRVAAHVIGRLTVQAISSLIVGRAAGLTHATARALFDALRGRARLTWDGFIDRLAEQLTLRAVFLDLVAHAAGTATQAARPAPPTPSAPPAPPPRSPPRLTSIPGEVPGRIAMRDGRVVSTRAAAPAQPRASARVSARGASLAQPAEQLLPAAEPQPSPVHLVPEPAPVQAPAPAARLGSPATSPVPAAVAVTASAGPGTTPEPTPHTPVTLLLPPQKAALASFYAGHLGRLQHRIGRERETDQTDTWDDGLDPRRGGDMTFENFCRGRKMEAHRPLPPTAKLGDRDVLRPRWSAERFWRDMQVDHRIEMQVTPIGREEAYDSDWNYELLDASSNGSSGPRLRGNINRERRRLAAHYRDASWLTRDLTFERIEVEPAAPAGRWSYAQVRDGLHLEAYKTLTGEPEPDPAEVEDCVRRGGR